MAERGTLAERVRNRENWTEKGSLRHNYCSEEDRDGGGGRRAEKGSNVIILLLAEDMLALALVVSPPPPPYCLSDKRSAVYSSTSYKYHDLFHLSSQLCKRAMSGSGAFKS